MFEAFLRMGQHPTEMAGGRTCAPATEVATA
jgi:hypothetical protein